MPWKLNPVVHTIDNMLKSCAKAGVRFPPAPFTVSEQEIVIPIMAL